MNFSYWEPQSTSHCGPINIASYPLQIYRMFDLRYFCTFNGNHETTILLLRDDLRKEHSKTMSGES